MASACSRTKLLAFRGLVSLLLVPSTLDFSALAQISAGGLGTRVNGSVFGRCLAGSCAVHGGTGTGDNLFHRLGQLDTRFGIQDVRIDTVGRGNVILAVSNPAGSFLSVPLTLSSPANLFVLSPGGLWLGQRGTFNKVPNLLLSTGVALDLPGGRFHAVDSSRTDLKTFAAGPALRFDAVATPADQSLVIGAVGGGSLVIDRALLSVAGSLIVDSPTGRLALRHAQLHAGKVLRLSGQGFALQDSNLRVGEPGRQGPIELRSNQDALRGGFGSGSLERVRISGNPINVSAGSLRILDSSLSSPKGWVELQTTNPVGQPADLALINTKIDLNPATTADLLSPQTIRRQLNDGSLQEIRNPVPHIGLFSRGNLQIERSLLDASIRVPADVQPSQETILGAFPARSGVIFAEAVGNLAFNASTLRSDATHNLAGYVLMEAGKDLQTGPSSGSLLVRDSQLSTSFGAGGGAIILQANAGLSVVNSSLTAISDRQPLLPGSQTADGLRPTFFGGQISLYNKSAVSPLLVSASTLAANQHAFAGSLNSPLLSTKTDQQGIGTFGNVPGWTLGFNGALSGGTLQLYSTAGLRVEARSRLDVSSLDPLSGKLDTIAGSIALLSSGPEAIEIEASRLEGRNGSAADPNDVNVKAGAIYIYGNGSIRVKDTQIDLSSSRQNDLGNLLAFPVLDISAGDLLSIGGNSRLVTMPSDTDPSIVLHDKQATEEFYSATTTRMFTGDATYLGKIMTAKQARPVQGPFTSFETYIEGNRINFEGVYTGSATERPTWPLPLATPPASSFAPLSLLRQPLVNSEAISAAKENQADASQKFLEGQQQALADTIASLGLSPSSGRVRSVPELQQRLLRIQQLSSSNPDTGKSVLINSPSFTPYRPAIVQLGLSELPGDQVQIKTILLLATGPPLSFSQTLPSERLKTTIRTFQRQLSRQEAIDAAASPAVDLARWLLQPMADPLRANGVNALLLAVDRGLQAIPYGALPFGDQPLAERFSLSVSPSLGLLDLDAERGSGSADGLLLAAGASRFQQDLEPLPMVPRELAALAGEQAATLLIDEAFTVEALRQQAQQQRFRRLHIATHADFQPGREEAAKLYTPQGNISLATLRQSLQSRPRDRSMDMITLSACHTALGDEQSELGFVGMALQAGVRSAIGTLWEVADGATAAFFIQYYRYLRSGLKKDQALQATARAFRNGSVRLDGDGVIGPRVSAAGEAQLLRVDSPEERRRLAAGLRHPHYWAGMVLTGSPW